MKFAHMADLHLGATSDEALKKLEIETLEKALGKCVDEEVDFLIISGDIFHVNIPDLAVVRDAVKAFMKFIETGRKIYVVYGSHDFSPNSTSIIDILDEAGVMVRVGKPTVVEGMLRPCVVRDERSGAIITGISGRRASLEKEAFAKLDREYLNGFKGFKIFVFHTGIEDVKRRDEKFEGIASSDLPPGFDYYAGGHIHRRIEISNGWKIFFPGPLFTGWGADMEATVKGERRGFFIVESNGGLKTKFVDITAFRGDFWEVDATGKKAQDVNNELKGLSGKEGIEGKVIVVKVSGEMVSGRTSEVDFSSFREALLRRGALYLHLSRNQLRTRETVAVTITAENATEVEDKVFKELEGTVKIKGGALEKGSVMIAKDVLAQLRLPKAEGETESDYEARLFSATAGILGVKKLLGGD